MVELILLFLTALIGLYGILFSKNLIRSIISFEIMQSAIILMFIFIGQGEGTKDPILKLGSHIYVDPLPQALMITVIVIGAGITALLLLMSVKVFHYYGSIEWRDLLSDKKGE